MEDLSWCIKPKPEKGKYRIKHCSTAEVNSRPRASRNSKQTQPLFVFFLYPPFPSLSPVNREAHKIESTKHAAVFFCVTSGAPLNDYVERL